MEQEFASRTSFSLQMSKTDKSFAMTRSDIIIKKLHKENVIHKSYYSRKIRQQMYNILIFIIIIIESVQGEHHFQVNAKRLFGRNKRAASYSETPQFSVRQQQQQQTIPAANPNFEAAFQGECGKNNNSNPCEHICLDLHDGTYECSCFYGFTLAVDGYSCAHIVTSSHQSSFSSTTKGSSSFSGGLKRSNTSHRSAAAAAAAEALRAEATTRRESTNSNFKTIFAIKPKIGQSPSSFAASAAVTDNDVSLKPTSASGRKSSSGSSQQQQQQQLKQSGGEWIEKSANDNRKLADELARGYEGGEEERAHSYNNYIGLGQDIRTTKKRIGLQENQRNSSSGSSSSLAIGRLRRQRMLLEAVARIRHEEKLRSLATSSSKATASTTNGAAISRQHKDENGNNNKQQKREKERRTGFHTNNYPEFMLSTKLTANGITQPKNTDNNEENVENQQQDKETAKEQEEEQEEEEQSLEANTVTEFETRQSLPLPSPQMTSAITESGVTHNKAPIDGTKSWVLVNKDGKKQRLTYELDQTTETEQQNRGPTSEMDAKQVANNEQQLFELNLEFDEEDLDPEVRSIMINNDKLLARLTNSVLAPPRISAAEEKEEVGIITNVGDHLNEVESGSGNKQLDYELNLLVDLVGQTMREEEDNSLYFTNEQNYQTNVGSIGDNQTDNYAKINEPLLSSPTTRDQSFYPKEGEYRETQRKRRSHLSESSTVLSSTMDDDETTHSTNNNETIEIFRDCSEMPTECESGGQCLRETVWISSRSSDLAQLESRARCRCPIGRGGLFCQKPIQIKTPKFMGQSYLALPMIMEPSITSLRLVFKPQIKLAFDEQQPQQQQQQKSSLLLYSSKFHLILDDMQRVELRYSTPQFTYNNTMNITDSLMGSKLTRVIGSKDAEINRWNELIVTDVSEDSHQSESSSLADGRIILVTPERIKLEYENKNQQELFVAGFPDLTRKQNLDLAKTRKQQHSDSNLLLDDKSIIGGFMGCIKELSINGRYYNFKSDLEGDALDGFDVVECC